MPCIHLEVSCPISSETEVLLKQDFAQVISIIPNKSEKWLMCVFESKKNIWLSGTNEPAAFVSVGLFGNALPASLADVTKALSDVIANRLNIGLSRIYIQYALTPFWGWNRHNL
jgi:hypothetical protein